MQPTDYVYLLFFAVMIFSAVLWLLVYFFNRDEVHGTPVPTRHPSITFLVPAYNEEDTIEETLDALLDLDYPEDRLQIIAINDGSTDGTLEKMRQYADRGNVQVIDKENGGKAHALNTALEQVDTELVACMDADSYPEPDFLHHIVGYLDRDGVKGVTPALKVWKPETLTQKIIWTEYIFQIFLRKMFGIFDTQFTLPGPGSIYDAQYLKDLGGWDEETLTEDMEVTFRMHYNGARVDNSAKAFVHTVSPPTLRGLFRQRIRWYRGYIENVIRYWDMMGDPRQGNLGMFLLPFNVLWLLLIMFFFTHFFYRIGDALVEYARTYLLVGYMPPTFSFSLMGVSLFHIFSAFFLLTGIGTILISIKTAEEDIHLWKRKAHYVSFLLLYPFLFAAFWIATLYEEFIVRERRW